MIMLIFFSYHILHSILGSVYTSMQFVYIHQTLLYKYCTCVYCMECIFPKISGLCMCTYVMHILYMRILHGMYIFKTFLACACVHMLCIYCRNVYLQKYLVCVCVHILCIYCTCVYCMECISTRLFPVHVYICRLLKCIYFELEPCES